MHPKVSIIVLNWNGKKDTQECLNSLSSINYPNFDVILVDNGSSDGSVEFFKNNFPKIKLIANMRNLGFAEGNNVGVKFAVKNGANYVFLLNNDTRVDKDVLKELVCTAQKDEKIAIVGPKVYNYYKKNQLESAGYSQSILLSKTYPVGYLEEDKGQHDLQKEVNFVSGCAMLIKSAAIKDFGVFDPYFFAYCEDQDFCYSVLKDGFKIVYSPAAKVWHKVSASTGGYKSYISVYLFTRNRVRFVLKRANFFQKIFFFSYFFVYYIPAFTVFSFLSKNRNVAAFYRALFSFVFNNLKYFEFEHYSQLRVGINARYIQRKVTGIEKYILQCLSLLSKIDSKNKYVLFFSNNFLPKLNLKPNFSRFITKFPTKSAFARIIWEQFWLSREIRKEKINLFHGTSFVLPLFKPCRYLLTIYDLSYLYYPESYTFLNRLYYRLFLKHSVKMANRIIAISTAAKNEIVKEFGVSEKKIDIIYPAFDDDFAVMNKIVAKDFLSKNYHISEPFFLFVGSLIPRKNLVRIILAFNKIKDQSKHKLVVIGKKGWLYEEIFDTVKKLNLQSKVIFTNYVPEDDLPYFYNAATSLVFASLHEGFGIPILEAMACGCPVITSNKSSMPEVAGDSAILVDPLNIDDISAAMNKIISDEKLRIELIKKGLERVKLFSWEKSAQQLLDVYEKM